MDHPIHQATKSSPFGGLAREEFYKKHRLLHQETFFLNHQNMKIYTQSWRPASPSAELKGLVAMVHGYASESGWIFALTAVAIARLGYSVCALDLRGHGRSDGRRGHVRDINPVVEDCIRFFDSARSAHNGLPAFLYGESLGGAIAMLIAIKQKGCWSGLVLNGAMCGVSRKFKPPWPMEKLLPLGAFLMPNWRVVVTESLVSKSYKLKWKRELVRKNPRAHRCEHPPASTALELLRVCEKIGRNCNELELPLLLLHGKDDSVCDCESAELVFKMAGSEDKTLRVIPGMWHQLIGEEEEKVEFGFGIILSWLEDRAKGASLVAS